MFVICYSKRLTNLRTLKSAMPNPYSNHYRVNIYTREYDDLYQIDRIRLSDSYLCAIEGKELLFGTVYQQKVHWHKTPHFTIPKSAPKNSGTHTFTKSDQDHGATFSLKK